MRSRGFTLVELLVAATITGVALAAASGWLWNVAALAGKTDDRAQAVTIAAACARAVARDVGTAVAVSPPPPGREPARTLALQHDAPASAAEDVLLVWDPTRRVLWRNAPGTYLGDHVVAFDVAYLLADGALVPAGEMETAGWGGVRGVRVDLVVVVGAARRERSLLVSVRPA
jgi:prepilin-type N-terminal cleavage/methylation domain-containing protein